jgi:hypothetical protein
MRQRVGAGGDGDVTNAPTLTTMLAKRCSRDAHLIAN